MKRISYILLFILLVFIAVILVKRQDRVNRMNEKQQKEEPIIETEIKPAVKIPDNDKKVEAQTKVPDTAVSNHESIKMDLLNKDPYIQGIMTDIMGLESDKEEQKQMLADLTLNMLVDIKKIKDRTDIPPEVKKGKITEMFRISEAISNRVDESIRKDYLSIVWGKNTGDIAGKRLDQAVEEKYQDVLRVLYAAGGHKNVELDDETDKMLNYYVYELVRGQYDNTNFINDTDAEGNYQALFSMLTKFYDQHQLRLGMPNKYWFKIDN